MYQKNLARDQIPSIHTTYIPYKSREPVPLILSITEFSFSLYSPNWQSKTSVCSQLCNRQKTSFSKDDIRYNLQCRTWILQH
jgi:hypothetical protein